MFRRSYLVLVCRLAGLCNRNKTEIKSNFLSPAPTVKLVPKRWILLDLFVPIQKTSYSLTPALLLRYAVFVVELRRPLLFYVAFVVSQRRFFCLTSFVRFGASLVSLSSSIENRWTGETTFKMTKNWREKSRLRHFIRTFKMFYYDVQSVCYDVFNVSLRRFI